MYLIIIIIAIKIRPISAIANIRDIELKILMADSPITDPDLIPFKTILETAIKIKA